jgi:ABC-2 type transport system ATP-binding protein
VADRLSKRYGQKWALRDCSLTVPDGRLCALVGPNGAGKSTLLQLTAGLIKPSGGRVETLGSRPNQDREWLAQIGYLAQELPLYKRLTADELLGMGRHLNPGWDDAFARRRLTGLGFPLDQPVGQLSGGERAQVALALALGKRPRLLLLDEPVASLDPLARQDFLAGLAMASAETELTVLLSSHLVADIERVCDYLVVLSASHVQLSGDVEQLLSSHRLLTGPRRDTGPLVNKYEVIAEQHTERQTTVLVRSQHGVDEPWWEVSQVRLEELVLAYMRRGASARTVTGAPAEPFSVGVGGVAR